MEKCHKNKYADHTNEIKRINRIEGQVRGIKKMVEDGKYCVDILTQVKAARSALKSLEINILEAHANHCLIKAMESGSKKDVKDKIDEIMELLKRTNKS